MIKVLWFTNTPSLYATSKNAYNGGGWITSAQRALMQRDDVKLAVSFEMAGEPWKVERDTVIYYPLVGLGSTSKIGKVRKRLMPSESLSRKEWRKCETEMLRVVNDFQPDIIHVFGSERFFGLVASVTDKPLVLHLQGIITPIRNALLPPGISRCNYVLQDLNPIQVVRRWLDLDGWKHNSCREQEIFRRVCNYIGRTDWDRRCVDVMHPGAHYYYGSEVLRPVFYQHAERQLTDKLVIISTISSPMYKGFDMALKTAKLLKENLHLDFEWRMFGDINPKVGEKLTGIKHDDVGIKICGVASAEKLFDELLKCTVYVHISYIDNSPNSVCEAQMIGVPVVVTHVGGTPSLIEEGKTGFSVPANDPWQAAAVIAELYADRDLNVRIGIAAKRIAMERHNPETVISDLLNTYKSIVESKRC